MERIDADELEPFVRTLVARLDAEETVATAVAKSLVGVDLVGHRSHGSIRMGTLYREMVESGKIEQLEAEKTHLDDRIADKRAELDDKEAEIEDADATVDDTREQKMPSRTPSTTSRTCARISRTFATGSTPNARVSMRSKTNATISKRA